MKRPLLMIFAVACASAFISRVDAHAFLDHAMPAVGSSVHGSPTQIQLWFTQRLEPAFSTVHVLDNRGKQVDKGDSRVDGTDAALLFVSLPQLLPGTYRVMWRVLSVDTHVNEGDFTFDVTP